MTQPLSTNAQAILLLTAPLIAGRNEGSAELLSPGEFNRLARILRENTKEIADLLGPDAKEVLSLVAPAFLPSRLEELLGRGLLLSQAVERWSARSIWVVTRADAHYPGRLKSRLKEDAPAVLFGCGDPSLLEQGGLAVVGSRDVTEEMIAETENVGRLAAGARRVVISGGAKGIDRAAMNGALVAGGITVGVLADSLERAAVASAHREALMDRRLVLISPYDPAAGFNVGHAMQRNKLIYALADAALVVTSDFEKGGTWAGAIEQINKLRLVPVFVRGEENVGKGNKALLERGAFAWPGPKSVVELDALMTAAPLCGMAPEWKQESFAL